MTAERVPMEETSINKYGQSFVRKKEVRTAVNISPVKHPPADVESGQNCL